MDKTITISVKTILKVCVAALIIGVAISAFIMLVNKIENASRIAGQVSIRLKSAKDVIQDKYQIYAQKYKDCFDR